MVVEFPCDKLVSPAVFQVKVDVGTKVYFLLKGVLVEGVVESYFGHMTPDKNIAKFGGLEGGAKPARVSNIGYAVVYYVPNQDGSLVKQMQLLDEAEFFLSLNELISYMKKNCFLRLPKDIKTNNDEEETEV